MWRVRVFLGDEDRGIHRLHPGAECVVGRDPAADLQIPERSVSRRHCILKARAEGIEVTDLGSANGVYLGRRRVRQALLRGGDELRVGLARLEVSEDLGQTGLIPIPTLDSSLSLDVLESVDLNRSVVSTSAYSSLEKDRLAVLVEAGKSLSSAVDLDALLERILDHLFQILTVRRAVLALLEPDGRLVAKHFRPTTDQAELSDLCSQNIIRQVIESGQPRIIDDAASDRVLSMAQSIRSSGIRAAISAPLISHKRTLGALYADYPGRSHLYTPGDLEFVGAFASLCGIAIENARMQEELRLRERKEREWDTAAEIQKSLLPDITFQHDALDLDWVYLPSRQVGGDFYDCFSLDDGRVAVVLGDVTGKSVGAALLMAQITSCVRTLVPTTTIPSEILNGVNGLLAARTGQGMFASACFLVLDPAAGNLVYASAGHNPGLLLLPGRDDFIELPPTGMMLGVLKEAPYEERTFAVPPGSVLLLYTDGIVEARNRAGQFFGLDATKRIVLENREGSARAMIRALEQAVRDHSDPVAYTQDDIAVVAIRFLGAPTVVTTAES